MDVPPSAPDASPPVLTTIGIAPAKDFPRFSYERTHDRLTPFADSTQAATWRQFGLAWNAVAYRHQACAEYDQAFRDIFEQLGSNSGGLDRYHQQRDLYGCVVNACSVIESFFYAAHAVGALIDAGAFPTDTPRAQRAIGPEMTAKRFGLVYAGDTFTTVLESVIDDPAWAELNLLRNVLVHRAAPGKSVHLTTNVEAQVPDQLRLNDFHLADRDFDEQLTRDCRDWVTRALGILCEGLDEFSERQFQSEGPPASADEGTTRLSRP